MPKSWITDALENADSESDYEDDSDSKKQKNILYWTRVKSLNQIKSQRLMIYDSAPDLNFDKNLKQIRKELRGDQGSILFDPAAFTQIKSFLTLDSYQLSKEELLKYA